MIYIYYINVVFHNSLYTFPIDWILSLISSVIASILVPPPPPFVGFFRVPCSFFFLEAFTSSLYLLFKFYIWLIIFRQKSEFPSWKQSRPQLKIRTLLISLENTLSLPRQAMTLLSITHKSVSRRPPKSWWPLKNLQSLL